MASPQRKEQNWEDIQDVAAATITRLFAVANAPILFCVSISVLSRLARKARSTCMSLIKTRGLALSGLHTEPQLLFFAPRYRPLNAIAEIARTH